MITLLETPIEAMMREDMQRGKIEKIADIIEQKEIGPYRVDFLLIPKHRKNNGVIVECDGEEFHTSPEAIIKDAMRDEYLKRQGYRILHFTGADIYYHYVHDDGFMASQIKQEIMDGVEVYATGREFIEIIMSDGNAVLVPK